MILITLPIWVREGAYIIAKRVHPSDQISERSSKSMLLGQSHNSGALYWAVQWRSAQPCKMEEIQLLSLYKQSYHNFMSDWARVCLNLISKSAFEMFQPHTHWQVALLAKYN